MAWSLIDGRGRRKYLVSTERRNFIQAAIKIGGSPGTFCAVLAFCGARISEVLALTPERIDIPNCSIVFETLKRRERGIFREVPVPRQLIEYLDRTHGVRAAQADPARCNLRIWSWSRPTAWRRVKETMAFAGVPEAQAMPKALRHAFGVEGTQARVGLSLLKKWLGHAKLETTEIYATPIGREERALARLMWRGIPSITDGFWQEDVRAAPSTLKGVKRRGTHPSR